MSEYNFMKSGGNNLIDVEEYDLEFVKNISTIVVNFMDNALRSASIYIKHCGRNCVLKEDIKRGFMLEIFLFRRIQFFLDSEWV